MLIRGFPEEMYKKRKELGISIAELSRITDISRSSLHRYECGEMSPSGTRFLRICAVLKIDWKKFK